MNFVIIDGQAILHRAWHALPRLTDLEDRPISAVYGFLLILFKILDKYKPEYLAIAFDTKAPTFRHEVYKEYKATRIPQPQEFYDQIPITKEILQTFPIRYFEKDGFEADDLIATLAYQSQSIKDLKTTIISGDHDLLQLINEKTEVGLFSRGLTEASVYNQEKIKTDYGFDSSQLIDFKSLKGDPSDNISGVEGIGHKRALELIKNFGSIENIYKYLDGQTSSDYKLPERIRQNLLEARDQVKLNKKLVTLNQNVSGIELEKGRLKNFNLEKIKEKFKELGFKTLIKRIESMEGVDSQKKLF